MLGGGGGYNPVGLKSCRELGRAVNGDPLVGPVMGSSCCQHVQCVFWCSLV